MFDGTPEAIRSADTLTGAFLGARKTIGMGFKRAVTDGAPRLILEDAREHNLKDGVEFPLQRLVVWSPVCGLGRVQPHSRRARTRHCCATSASPPTRPRARPAARCRGGWARWCSSTSLPSARPRALQPGEFGRVGCDPRAARRCTAARQRGYTPQVQLQQRRRALPRWLGFEHVEMQFLSDVYRCCPDCDGKRYRPKSRRCGERGRSFAECGRRARPHGR